jgi:hypothetical protein
VQVALRIEAVSDPAAVQAAVGDWLRLREDDSPAAVLFEAGLPAPIAPSSVQVIGLTPGCPCCSGAVALRVTLVRLLRSLRPASVLLLLAGPDHCERLRSQVRSGELGVGLRLI